MGETCIRIDVTHGDGVYRSDDAGATWKHLGLDDTRHISRVRVHPNDPDLVYVAAFGHAFGPSAQRGIFRSRDGGESWQNVLYKSEDAGAADLSMDPNNPRILYASLWEARRSFWAMNSGGPGSGLYRSTDGGDTWDELTRNPGLPEGVVGRIGVAVSPARTGRVWALIEAEDGGLFRSDDGGESWQKLNDTEDVRSRPWYYTHVFADPVSPDTVYVLAPKALRSTDGGTTFEQINMPHSDQHDLWIDPSDTRRMIEGNDGGACVTYDAGETWSSIYNQPTSQFYSVVADNRVPYRVYGAQQDNSAVSVPSRSVKGVIPWEDCYTIGLSESGKVAVKPTDPDIVYSSYPGGTLLRYDHGSGQVRVIMVWPEYYQNSPPKLNRYRFGWEFPITISPHDPDTLYATGNIAFKSTDEGTTWQAISPDLTRDDKSKQELSGPITSEGPWGEIYCTIYAFAESPLEPGLLWAGTDDGLVHVSRDGGVHLERRHSGRPARVDDGQLHRAVPPRTRPPPTSRPPGTSSTTTAPSSSGRTTAARPGPSSSTAYPATTSPASSERTPSSQVSSTRGTETSVYAWTDDGASWTRMQLNLPVVPVYDLEVKDDDLIAATHGRSFWVLDDLSPLRQSASGGLAATHLFEPRPAIRFMKQLGSIVESGPGKHYASDILGAPASWMESCGQRMAARPGRGSTQARIRPKGAAVDFHLDAAPEGEVVRRGAGRQRQGRQAILLLRGGRGQAGPARPGPEPHLVGPALHHLRGPPGRGRRRKPLRRGEDRPSRGSRDLHRQAHSRWRVPHRLAPSPHGPALERHPRPTWTRSSPSSSVYATSTTRRGTACCPSAPSSTS